MAIAQNTAVDPAAQTTAVDPYEDRRARLRLVADRVAPLALAREQTLPVLPSLAGLFPGGAIRRGSVIAVEGVGATSMALAVAAGPSLAGSWTAVVGDSGIGLAAAAEVGVVLERLLVIEPQERSAWSSVLAALVGSVDVVIVGSRMRIRPADQRRLTARMRERGSILIRIGSVEAAGIDVGIKIVSSEWSGLGVGHGLLQSRRMEVCAAGRGASAQPRSAALLMPGPDGCPT